MRLIVETSGERLDLFVCRRIPSLSRNQAQRLIAQGLISLEQRGPVKPAVRLKTGQVVQVSLPEPAPLELQPEALDFEVIYQDEDLIVVNKPPGLVVHPSPGHSSGTLVHGLLHRCPHLKGVGGWQRPGIVHRLDKQTSGLIVAAKHDQAHQALSLAFKQRRMAG